MLSLPPPYACALQVAWTSFHNNKVYVRKFLSQFHIGHLVPEEREVSLSALL